jgi:hypothetical protein
MLEKGHIAEFAVFGLALSAMLVCAIQVRMGSMPVAVLLGTFLASWVVFFFALNAFVRMFRALG